MKLPKVSAAKALANVCKRSLVDFVREFWEEVPGAGKVVWNWHLDCLCDEMQVAALKVWKKQPREYDLIINVPFGSSKSTVISILFPAWVWTFFPRARFLTATHTDRLVHDFASKFRAVVKSDKYCSCFPKISFVQDQVGYLRNNHGGDRNTCTVGGKTPTGFHADFLLVDDPLDPQGARSELELETAAKFQTEVLPSRKTDKAVSLTVLIMQRLHYRDPTAVMEDVGKLEGSVKVRKICLPGEWTEDLHPNLTTIREKYGQEAYATDNLLDPVRLPRSVLTYYRAVLGQYGYAGQVLQKPTPPGGGLFKVSWFGQRVRSAPYDSLRVRYWDRASTQNGGCYTAGVLMAKDREGRLYIEDCVHGQWEPNERNDIIVATAHKDRSRYGPKNDPAIVVEAERGSTGLEAFQGLARRLMGFRVREDQPSGDKDTRAEPWADQLAAKNVWLVENQSAPWDIAGYIQEHELFRPDPTSTKRGKYKDQVDASAGALKMLGSSRAAGTPLLRIIPLSGAPKKISLRLAPCTFTTLETLVVENRTLLVTVDNPKVGEREPAAHALSKLLGRLDLEFVDLEPANLQDIWYEPIPPWNKPPAELVVQNSHGKALWSFLLNHKDPAPEVVIFASPGGRRALSLAKAVQDILRIPKEGVWDMDGRGIVNRTENEHTVAIIKAARGMVVG